ncbi:pentapeptide repeat-containing protein [Pararhodobacter oceanensis]|uniref:pentapeptide repeat-containing protein n=1 Tax=Pararhodobacter oceanensis TaxID=2172121 RepID=UPI003A9293CB
MPETPDQKPPKDLLDWLGITDAPNWRVARLLGPIIALIFFVLFALALAATFIVIAKAAFGDSEVTLGIGGLIAALLGAPFLIWGTVLKNTTVRYQKEGHMTDRINKAVEMLGTEKTVDRIGRPVTILTGKAERVSVHETRLSHYKGRARTKIGEKNWRATYDEEADEVNEGYWHSISSWPDQRTIVQWQGEPVSIETNEAIDAEGNWQVFSETQPNLEVRIGAILSLERIAQDSTTHDRGRDHVRVMEILCAYVRENAPASIPREKPRADVDTALQVIARRSIQQQKIEFEWRNIRGTQNPSPYSSLHKTNETEDNLRWLQKLNMNLGYKLNLSNTNLSGLYIKDGNFSGAIFNNTNFSNCTFVSTKFVGANFYRSSFAHTKLFDNIMDACRISYTDLSGTFLPSGSLKYATLSNVTLDAKSTVLADFHFTSIESSDFSGVAFLTRQMAQSFGDDSVILGRFTDRPLHWPKWRLNEGSANRFKEEVDKWRENPATYHPPLIGEQYSP